MKVICSFCRKDMGEKEPLEDTRPSHAICPECYDYYIDQFTGISFDEYLDRFDLPVFIVDAEGRMAASNQTARDTLGKNDHEVTGLLGGEVMECKFARLPEGCGKTEHCLECTIRNTVMETHETGRPKQSRRCYLNRDDKRYTVILSALKKGDFVQLVVEDMF